MLFRSGTNDSFKNKFYYLIFVEKSNIGYIYQIPDAYQISETGREAAHQFIMGPKAAKRPISLLCGPPLDSKVKGPSIYNGTKGHKAAHQFVMRPKATK